MLFLDTDFLIAYLIILLLTQNASILKWSDRIDDKRIAVVVVLVISIYIWLIAPKAARNNVLLFCFIDAAIYLFVVDIVAQDPCRSVCANPVAR
jgi:uncharacterized protein YdeI (YjbR/CyaY-like superfamily)